MKPMLIFLAALLAAAPLSAGPKGNRKSGSAVAPGVYAGYTYDLYLEFEVKSDGSVVGTCEPFQVPNWPDSYLVEHFLWGAVVGYVDGRGVTIDLEVHYDFPENYDVWWYGEEDQYDTMSLRASTDDAGNPILVANLGWGTKVWFVKLS